MKKRKSDYIFIACILLFAFTAIRCTDGIDTDPKNLIGRWRMEKVIHQGKTISKPDPPKWHSEVEMEFLKDGTIEGTMPTDVFSGSYVITGDSIKIDGRQFSKKGIPDWGEYFYNSFRLVTTFSFGNKGLNFKYNELSLIYADGKLIFKRVK
jgi:hypothetical protein